MPDNALKRFTDMERPVCDLKLAANTAACVVESLGTFEEIEGRGRGMWLDEAAVELVAFSVYQMEQRAEKLKALYYGRAERDFASCTSVAALKD